MTNQYVPRHHYSIQEFHFCKLRHGKFFRDSGRDQSSLHEKRLKRNGYLTLGLRRTAMRIDSGTGTLFSFLIQAINSGVSVSAITTASLEKWFPPALSGWRAMLQPFSDPTIPALRTISLDVAPGEAVALLGANGAGKSTLLRILATLLLPTRGSASVAGHDIVKEDSAVRMQIGYHAGTDQAAQQIGAVALLPGRLHLPGDAGSVDRRKIRRQPADPQYPEEPEDRILHPHLLCLSTSPRWPPQSEITPPATAPGSAAAPDCCAPQPPRPAARRGRDRAHRRSRRPAAPDRGAVRR